MIEKKAGTKTTSRRRKQGERLAALGGVHQVMLLVLFLVMFLWSVAPSRNSNNNDDASSVYVKTASTTTTTQSYHHPRLLLIRSINNLPYTRLTDMTACLHDILQQEQQQYYPNNNNLQRHWILNRIQPAARVLTLTKLLDTYHESYTIWEFDQDFYAHVPLQFGYYYDTTTNKDVQQQQQDPFAVYTTLYHHRLLYSVNWNGVLNKQVEWGNTRTTSDVEWILPWTYDMILTPAVYQGLMDALSSRRDRKQSRSDTFTTSSGSSTSSDDYLVVSIATEELKNNNKKSNADYALVARRGAPFTWDVTLRYGQHPGAWLQSFGLGHLINHENNNTDPSNQWQGWEHTLGQSQQQQTSLSSLSVPLVVENGVQILPTTVPRWKPPPNETLPDLVPQQEQQQQKLIMEYMDILDLQTARDTAGYHPREQWNLHTDRHALAYERRLWKAAFRGQPEHWRDAPRRALMSTMQQLHKVADEYYTARVGKWHVVTADQNDSKNNKNKNKKPVYQFKVDSAAWHALTRNVTVWALASHMSKEESYSRYAVKQLKEWFWHDDLSLAPRLADIVDDETWWDWLDLTFLLDAAKLMIKDGFFSDRQEMLFTQWCADFKEWMLTVKFPSDPITAAVYNAILAAVAFFAKDDALAYRTLSMAPRFLPGLRELIIEHSPESMCTDQIHRALYVWHVLARQSQIMGIQLWKNPKPWWNANLMSSLSLRIPDDPLYGDDLPNTSALCELTGNVALSCFSTAQLHWYPLWEGYRRFCSQEADVLMENILPSTRYEMVPLFDAGVFVAPFWNLGYRYT